MSDTIDYYSFCLSPFTLFGHDALKAVADRHGKAINYKPMKLFSVWENSEAVPPAKRPPVRQRYRFIELQRIALQRGIEINLKPAFFPTDPTLADNAAVAIAAAGGNPHGFMAAIGRAVWCEDRNVADEAVVRDCLSATGHDADAVIAAANNPKSEAQRDQNTRDAVEADAIGAPAYVYQGEVFWGQDRVEMLDDMIASGRPPFGQPA
ncbi:MAG: 2-hydroxychromene-2-carboxylate isomerase [Pseudomonadota bacterium]